MHKNDDLIPGYYAVIPASVLYDKKLSWAEKVMFAQISSLTRKDGHCWASNEYLGSFHGVSDRTVSRIVSKLQERGHIKVTITDKVHRKIYAIDRFKANIKAVEKLGENLAKKMGMNQ